MGKMTEKTYLSLFEYGKAVYRKELSQKEAAIKANEENPEVAVSSAKHYITWYSRMREGSYLTWNTNPELLIFYIKNILSENGLIAGKTAIMSALKYAKHAGKYELEADLLKIAVENRIDLSEDSTGDWWPLLTEYTSGITKEKWQELLPILTDSLSGEVLAMFYTEPQGITCAALGERYSRNATSISSRCTQFAKKVHKETDCLLAKGGEKEQYWPILFVGKNADNDERGVWKWKLRDELYAALSEFDILRFLPVVHEKGVFDSWEIIDENTAIKHCDKSFFDHNGSGVPKGICWFFPTEDLKAGENKSITLTYEGKEYSGRIAHESTDLGRVRIFWSTDLGKIFSKYRSEKNVMAQFAKVAENNYDISVSCQEKVGEEMPKIDKKEDLTEIKNYILSRGFSYPEGLIENFYLSLKSKPFVILAGTSGTGKTRLVKLFAEAIGAAFKMVPVRPDWSDGSDLFGHKDLNGNFIPGPVCEAFEKAEENREKPVFLCLDEMNLARVEYYLSDFLSVMESREKKDGHIVTDGIAQYEDGIPDNLYIVGTVNMDETTFPFSKKVLDRANTIEFNYVDLIPKESGEWDEVTPLILPNSFLQTEYLVLATDCKEEPDLVDKICTELQAFNEKLQKANAHVGYRVRDEIVFYHLNNKKAEDLLTYEQAMDNEILQKILPRIQGSQAAIKTLLIDLYKLCYGSTAGIDPDTGHVGEQMKAAAASAKYPQSAWKIGYMMTRYEDDGFTSYWL